MKKVHLIWYGDLPAKTWLMGEIMPVEYTPRSLSRLTEDIISQMDADAWLFWDGDLGWPEETSIQTLLEKTGDVFHAGLQLGMGGLPEVINYIRPTWMHNCDPSPAIEATSWRLSLRCCLIRGEVLRQLGGVLPQFQTLTGAGLELGYRFIQQGVVVRNTPLLIDPPKMIKDPVIVPFHDQALFLNLHFNRFWNRYALWRAWRNNIISLGQLINYYRNVKKNLFSKDIFNPVFRKNDKVWTQAQVSVLIPTLGRYDYLSKLLSQLRDQTLKPLEIIIVDQNDDLLREDLKSRFPDLPLTIIKQNKRGQSTARNAGLYVARGTHILFIDDDDEVPSDLIQKHVEALNAERCEVSCGVAHEKGAGPLPADFLYRRVSDVFPTNNSMILRSVLDRSGLFDLAFDHGPRADADIGMRMYLSGALMILNPEISLIHHHAPAGGLRTYKARVETYASSRKQIFKRNIPAATEFYLEKRYFSTTQRHESFLIRFLGTFSYHGSKLKKITKFLASLIMSPDTLLKINRAKKKSLLLQTNIPDLRN